MGSPPRPDRAEDAGAAPLPAPAAASIRFQPGGALRAWQGARPIRWSGSFGGMCLGLSGAPFALPLMNYFRAEGMWLDAAGVSAVTQVRVSLFPYRIAG